MNGVNYLLQTNLYLLLFMGFYVLVLRNETFFRQNRFFLNTSIFLSFVIPFINSDWFRDLFITQKVREAAIMPSQMIYEIVVSGSEEASVWTVSEIIFTIYATGAIFLLIRFLVRLALIRSNLKVKKGTAFSFFNTMIVDKQMPKAETIIDHEKVHMRQWHSADIIFIELAAIINWFNPVMYLYKKEIRHIHEFIADEEAATLMQSKSDYALLLFSNTLGVDPLHLSNNFFNKSLLKRRIIMLHKTKSHRTGLWKYGFSAPLFMMMLIVSAATATSERNALSIDADHSISPIENIGSLALPGVIAKTGTGVSINNSEFGVSNGKRLADQTDLKKHIATHIKYTAGAREAGAFGYIQVNFLVKNKKISDVEITKSLHPELDKEVMNAFTSFNAELSIPDNDYVITITYLDTQRPVKDQLIEKIPKNTLFAKNYLGEVLAMVKENGGFTAGWNMTTTRPNPRSGQQEAVGYDGSSAQDKMPEFPGGMKAWGEYLTKTLRYPVEARNNNVKGRVIVGFTVEKDGSIHEIKVLRGIGSGADEEAVRVIATSPKWIPGTKNGVPAKAAYTISINFGLSEASNPVSISSTAVEPADVLNFSSVEVLPEFSSGLAGWSKYLQANLKYPEEAKKAKVTGRVIMAFVVEKDGSLSDIKVIRGLGSGLDEEALRVLSNTPKWKPGIQDGRPVRVKYTMPIFFQLAPESDKKQ